jgi:hypothetical protein
VSLPFGATPLQGGSQKQAFTISFGACGICPNRVRLCEHTPMLTSILGRVGGSPNTSPREHVDSVYKALTTNGAKRGIDYDHPFSDLLDGGALYFGDYKE